MTQLKKVYFHQVSRLILKLVKILTISAGCVAIGLIFIAFTTLPFKAIHWLGTSKLKPNSTPDYIVVMGGSAMPGKSGLIRTYYAAKLAGVYPDAKIIIALPGDIYDSNSSIRLMQKEMQIRNINPDRIILENTGKNTRFQAMEIYEIIRFKNAPVIIVTSPAHMRRAILAFEKIGFGNVNGLPAFEAVHDFDLLFKDDELGGKKSFLPDIGRNTQIRYQFWNHLEYEITFLREIIALGYYNLRDWI